jgi:hypothetical protein
MLRDERSDRGGRRHSPRNVFGEPLEICSIKPMPLAGRKRLRQNTHRAWSCAPHTSPLWLTARFPTLSALLSTWHECSNSRARGVIMASTLADREEVAEGRDCREGRAGG